MQIIVFLGPPGSGKGTQAGLINQRKGYHLISTGNLLRDEMKIGSDYGIRIKGYVDNGLLVPDELINDFIINYIESNFLYEKKLVLDGFPRRLSQAVSLDGMLMKHEKKVDAVILINLLKDDIINRIIRRLVCADCGKIFKTIPDDKLCDICGGILIQRNDDNKVIIEKRIGIYNNETQPMLDFYGKKNILFSIDGNGTIEEVYNRILGVIER